MQMPRFFLPLLGLTVALLGAACSPNAKRDRALAAADKYYTAGDYDRAEVEYLNVLKSAPTNPQAIARLALIYSDQGRVGAAITYLRKGNELLPEDLDLRVKLAQLDIATGNPKEARAQANYILEHRPGDANAPMILTATATSAAEGEEIAAQLKKLPAPAATSAPVLTALGMLEARRGQTKAAEELCRQALQVDPGYAEAYVLIATIQLSRKEEAAGIESFKRSAELSPPRSPRRLQYAQFLLRSGKLEEGKQAIEEITRKTPDYLPAWIALAESALMERKYEECETLLDRALARDAHSLEALLIRGRLRLAQGRPADALSEMEKLSTTYPMLPPVLFELARAQAASGDIGSAITNLNQVMARAPGHFEAAQTLAALNLRKGDLSAALVVLRRLVQQRPDLLAPRLMMAEALSGQGNADEAVAIYGQVEKDFPQNPEAPLLRGLVLVRQKKFPAAREAFERSHSLVPDAPLPLEQLVNLDVTEGKSTAALERVKAEIARNPKNEGVGQLLLAKIYLANKDYPAAEIVLKKALELMPDNQTASMLLAGLYNRTNQLPKALEQLEQTVARNPKDASALLLIGVLRDQQKDFPGARDAYQKAIAVNPRSATALNNLAYLLSEKFGQLDQALEYAENARKLEPQSGDTADTLGWILYQKKQYPRALSLMQQAAEQRPGSAEIQLHLGMTHYVMGEEQPARIALERALQIDSNFTGAAQARQALDVLQIDPAKADAGTKSRLGQIIGQRTDDPVALLRLAAIEQREGRLDEAAKSLEAALQINNRNVSVLLALARLEATRKDPARALELAKAARKLAPSDGEIAQTLGRLAYELGDYAWAASLLQEAARRDDPSPELLFDLGLTSYSVGRVSDAEAALRQSIEKPGISLQAAEARRLLDFIAWAKTPSDAAKQSARAATELQRDPADVPALMVAARAAESRGDAPAARAAYDKALARFPDFTPAKARLAVLGAASSTFDQRSYDLALHARTAYPTDPEIARALGILTYRKADYTRAIALLKEAANARNDDAEIQYYLGLAQIQVKDVAGEQSLRKSIELGLSPNLAAEARKVLDQKK